MHLPINGLFPIDYFFLEEIARSTETAHRELLKNCGERIDRKGKKRKRDAALSTTSLVTDLSAYPKSAATFVTQAKRRGVDVKLLPNGMSKRKVNSSYYNAKADVMQWRIEWKFPSSEVPVNLYEKHANEHATVRELLSPYLETQPLVRAQLLKYVDAFGFSVLLRKEFVQSPTPQYFKLDLDRSVAQNLQRKTVVEFPVLEVVLDTNLSSYKIVHDSIEVVSIGDPV